MRTQAEKAAAFRALHARPGAFIIPNPWDAGTAKLLASLGFEALATTSLGLANMLGRADGTGAVTTREVLDNCRMIAEATALTSVPPRSSIRMVGPASSGTRTSLMVARKPACVSTSSPTRRLRSCSRCFFCCCCTGRRNAK